MRARAHACVFVGPSLAGYSVPCGIDVFPPATRGALDAAVRAGYRRIGIIDGSIYGSRLPRREIARALAVPGLALYGGASMGAVRAAEMQAEGMNGIGRVYRLLRRGWSDRDETYVLHAPAALHYRCLTWPLVNIRYTLRAMSRLGRIGREEEQAIVAYMRQVPWFERDRGSLSAAIYGACARSRPDSLLQAFESSYRDVKREDALLVISMLLARSTSFSATNDVGMNRNSTESIHRLQLAGSVALLQR